MLTVYTEYLCILCKDTITIRSEVPTQCYQTAKEYALVANDSSTDLIQFEKWHSKHTALKYKKVEAL